MAIQVLTPEEAAAAFVGHTRHREKTPWRLALEALPAGSAASIDCGTTRERKRLEHIARTAAKARNLAVRVTLRDGVLYVWLTEAE